MRRDILAFLAMILLGLGVMGCGDDEDQQPVDTGPREGYPAAPFGITEGSTLDNLSFTDTQGNAYTLQQIYADGKNQVLLISTAAGWCTACIEEQASLQALYEEYQARGLAVLVAVFEDENFEPSTAEYAASWQDRYDLTGLVVADIDNAMGAYYDTNSAPMNMIVDVPTMTIERINMGWDESVVRALVESMLP